MKIADVHQGSTVRHNGKLAQVMSLGSKGCGVSYVKGEHCRLPADAEVEFVGCSKRGGVRR